MKKNLVLFMINTLLLSGCASVSQDIMESQQTLEAETFSESTKENGGTGEIIIPSELQQIPDFAGELDFTYVYGTDAESDLKMYSNNAYTKEGLYCLEAKQDIQNMIFGFQLFFYDAQTKEKVLVCSKSNCTHEGTDCDAFFDGMEYGNGILYYQDALYQMKTDGDYLKMEKISRDGSAREDACTLLRQVVNTTINEDGTQSTRYYFPEVQIHRGYVYFANISSACDGYCLYRIPLEGDEEPEVLFTLTGSNPDIYRIKPYGRYVFFQMINSDISGQSDAGSIYAYDTERGSVSRIKEGAYCDFCISDHFLYYFRLDNTLWRVDLETGEETLYHESEEERSRGLVWVYSCKDQIIYEIRNPETEYSTQLVLDEKGKELEVRKEESGDELLPPYIFG